MKLIETEHCYFLEKAFGASIITGFTKTSLNGDLPGNIKAAFSFYKKERPVGYMKQTHSADIATAVREGQYKGDGLFTRKKNLVLAVRTADCLPLIFYSKEERIIGVVHMGWKGAGEGILENIEYDLSSFRVAAGPGLRKCCYEVGKEFEGYFRISPFLSRKKGRTFFDPVEFAREALVRNGLKGKNFLDMEICTACGKKELFSFRKHGTESRTLSFVMRK
ncbi:MAG: polyphenol oxidase family protein [Candidatus Omnitrophota bacterium]